jgi:hypothetical protein
MHFKQFSAHDSHLLTAAHDVARGRATAVINNLYLQAAFPTGKLGTFAYGFFLLCGNRLLGFFVHGKAALSFFES